MMFLWLFESNSLKYLSIASVYFFFFFLHSLLIEKDFIEDLKMTGIFGLILSLQSDLIVGVRPALYTYIDRENMFHY